MMVSIFMLTTPCTTTAVSWPPAPSYIFLPLPGSRSHPCALLHRDDGKSEAISGMPADMYSNILFGWASV